MISTTKAATGTTVAAIAIAAFGLDEAGKPHAARFEGDDVALARKAADMMKLTVVELTTAELREIGAVLPAGKLYATGKAFVPFVKQETFDRLAALVRGPSGEAEAQGSAPGEATSQGNAAGEAKPGASRPPAGSALAIPQAWEDVRVGSLVLGHEGPDEGWWEAIVTDIKGDNLVVRWRDFPEQVPMVMTRKDIAFLPAA